jgi:hypothetical protein
MINLESFIVLKKLSIHNIRLEPRKVTADYSVETFAGALQTCPLIYSFEHRYFDKSDPVDLNTASMMLAQAALNYGLFCETIELYGYYDRIDRDFLTEMLENTSREILTNKLLVENKFILEPFQSLQVEKRKSYTNADLVFKEPDSTGRAQSPVRQGGPNFNANGPGVDQGKYAVLSSGGKDSLLTYGITKEIGEVYPVFINESGRHWFTAVNSYKYYKEHEPNTEKVWCNSDRVFNWMLRQLPLIKKNYTSIRADYYPLRLWTVAVFLFGVLPIVIKKGIGNILIGNEYDTTQTNTLFGIKHFNGLYDQSKYFDNRLTRYFRSKGLKVNQFSILRSMSELLIQKSLIQRYPQLQRNQISCHAAHESNGRMYPCGKCEKCRRIVGMLKALDENPQVCGYSETQIAENLESLEKQTVKQLGSDASHLYYLLLKKGLIRQNDMTAKQARAHPEIMMLRFDRKRSNLADLPLYIRKPLFNIIAEYSEGAVIRNKSRWENIDLNEDNLSSISYKMEKR